MVMEKGEDRFTRNDFAFFSAFGLAKILIHLAAIGRYGIFRDEFYYLACAGRLDWGYVDHPPFSIAVLAAWTALMGDSMATLRVPAMLAGAATVVLAGILARELGGRRFAQGVACLAVIIAPIYLAVANFYSMNVFDQLIWTILAWLFVRYLNRGDARLWLWFGLVAGIGLQNKVSVLFLGAGVVAGLLGTAQRRVFLSKEIWIGGAIATVIFSPYVIWNFQHDFATIEFMHNAATTKNSPTSPLALFLGTVLEMHPANALLWIAGLGYALLDPIGRRFRAVGIAFVTVFLAFAFSNGKVYYLAPIMPLMLALGGVAWEQWTAACPKWRLAVLVPMAILGPALIPMALPVFTPEAFIRYQDRIGLAPAPMERHTAGALPPHFADRQGWREMAEFVALHCAALDPAERPTAAVLVRNYGEAGALEYFGRELDLPEVLCPHNNFFLWGVPGNDGAVLLAYGYRREALEQYYGSVVEVGRFTHPYVMPYENDVPLYVCREAKQPIGELWGMLKVFV